MNQKNTATEKLVSVIIPVYNAQNWLRRCVVSVENQDYKNIEIILVDDGSKDESGKICDELSGEYPNIRVVHQENAGPSAARNAGIRLANGYYIEFVDADDYLNCDCIAYLVYRMESDKTDVAICGYRQFNANGAQSFVSETDNVLSIKEFGSFLKKWGFHCITGSPVNRIYKADIIKNNNLLFHEDMKYSEDHIFNMDYFYYVDSISIVNYTGYNISTENEDSASRNSKIDLFTIKTTHKFMLNHLEKLLYAKEVPEANIVLNTIRACSEFSYVRMAATSYDPSEFSVWIRNEERDLDARSSVLAIKSCGEWSKAFNIAYAIFRWVFLSKMNLLLYVIYKMILG